MGLGGVPSGCRWRVGWWQASRDVRPEQAGLHHTEEAAWLGASAEGWPVSRPFPAMRHPAPNRRREIKEGICKLDPNLRRH